jgi:glycosyltransferase involved in cell wall biosynthesis
VKVLYIGVYRDGSGYGQAAIDYILALDSVGVDVVCRPLKLNNANPQLPPRLLQLEGKSSSDCDVVIQHVLPHQMDYSGRFKKNIGLFAYEMSNFRTSAWAERLNMMDEVWAINQQQAFACRDSGVKVPVYVIPHATNVERFQCSYPVLDGLRPYKEQGDFLFYAIGEFVRRKNYATLLKAFHLEFSPSEPVQLVIKTSMPGKSKDETLKYVNGFANDIKRGLKLHGGHLESYKQELVIAERTTDESILSLHSTCNCFVLPSYGEAWCIPAFDAMAMGKTPIVTDCCGFQDYMSDDEGWMVKCHREPAFGVMDSFQDLYVGTESWQSADVGHLQLCMRQAFADRLLQDEKAFRGTKRAYEFSYEKVGMTMKERLLSNGEKA